MAPSLAVRDPDVAEFMDAPDCDPERLARTYELFPLVNAVVGGWRRVYRREVRPRARRGAVRVLDVGCGGADVARALLHWAARDGVELGVLGIDPDVRAIEWASRQSPMAGLSLRAATSHELVTEGAQFDLVISNHVLHHLGSHELAALLDDSTALLAPGGTAIHRDIARGRLAFAGFAITTALVPSTHLRRSFIRADGLSSIRRAYRADELAAIAPAGWAVGRAIPARLELRRQRDVA